MIPSSIAYPMKLRRSEIMITGHPYGIIIWLVAIISTYGAVMANI
ncbi:MAG TPA: hypothetical protein PLT82_05580 [Candidatus Hydrogenedens sp.]|nr:hypothetical protein [Candidatus Hydrogenedens sp.]HOL21097.1 hypothetical protein [Candidatus Hydrogenedens sp.]HPP58584.1 hypothetical protein [Candidatus Hydrogenedens sp.]